MDNEKLIFQWNTLTERWAGLNSPTLTVEKISVGWRVVETFNDRVVFDYRRHLDNTRHTEIHSSLVGITTLEYSTEVPVFVTEGVSDFLSLKLLGFNVVGHTTVQWSDKDINFLSNFPKVILVGDNDSTGLNVLTEAVQKFPNNKARITLPYFNTSKDATDDFLRTLNNKDFLNYVITHYETAKI